MEFCAGSWKDKVLLENWKLFNQIKSGLASVSVAMSFGRRVYSVEVYLSTEYTELYIY